MVEKNFKIVGYAYVVADLIHVGHLNHLEVCKSLCDILIVGVLTDDATMEKKPKPIIPFSDRLRMVKALKCVDSVVAQDTYSPLANAISMKVHILFESTSHSENVIKYARTKLAKQNSKVLVLPYYEDVSSTAIKEKIRSL